MSGMRTNNKEHHSLPTKFGVYIDELIVVNRAARGNADAAAPPAAPVVQDTPVSQAAADKAQAEHDVRSTKNKASVVSAPAHAHTLRCALNVLHHEAVCALFSLPIILLRVRTRESVCATRFKHGVAAHTVAVLLAIRCCPPRTN